MILLAKWIICYGFKLIQVIRDIPTCNVVVLYKNPHLTNLSCINFIEAVKTKKPELRLKKLPK